MNRTRRLLLACLPALAGCLSFHPGALPGEPKNATFAEVEGARVRYLDTDPSSVGSQTTIETDDGNEAVATATKEKPTVVMVHGFASSLENWAPVIPVISKQYRIVALDLKGFGWTDRPEGDYSPEAQAKLVLRLMDARGVKSAMLVAHSWGSSVALQALLLAPERFTRVALYDAWVYEDQLPTFFHWSRAAGVGEALFGLWYNERVDERMSLAFYDKRFVTERFVEDVEKAVARPGTRAAALAAVRGQRYADVESKYKDVKQPTLLMWGREDTVTPLKYGERLSRELQNARMIVYPRCGHFPMIEARDASNRDLLAWLGGKDVFQ
ncbi:MAG: alpha/beta hydrolase [Labilithrix sp.]|nr:alpha/beta hydrolase [Labilithrix sp.]MCW5811386.1 alpha/beta hydrolase [Labilithrix sp.]